MSQEEREKVLNDYQQAVQGLEFRSPADEFRNAPSAQSDRPSQLGAMPLNSLSQEQLDQLKKAFKEGAAACQKCAGSGDGLPV
ncbi:MAG: hypothetical protein R3F31_18265 [Verrucomicrobiales bacterium]